MYTLYNTQGYKTYNIYIVMRDFILLALWECNLLITRDFTIQLLYEFPGKKLCVIVENCLYSCTGKSPMVNYLNTMVYWMTFLLYIWKPLGYSSVTLHFAIH